MLTLLVQILMVKKCSAFIVTPLRQVLWCFTSQVKFDQKYDIAQCILNCNIMKIRTSWAYMVKFISDKAEKFGAFNIFV